MYQKNEVLKKTPKDERFKRWLCPMVGTAILFEREHVDFPINSHEELVFKKNPKVNEHIFPRHAYFSELLMDIFHSEDMPHF